MQSNLKPIEWMESMQTAFDELRKALTSTPCLALPDSDYYRRIRGCEGSRRGIQSK